MPTIHEISSGSSSSPPRVNGYHNDDSELNQPPRASAASRVSLANLLGPTGPGSSPYPSPPRGSPSMHYGEARTMTPLPLRSPGTPSSQLHSHHDRDPSPPHSTQDSDFLEIIEVKRNVSNALTSSLQQTRQPSQPPANGDGAATSSKHDNRAATTDDESASETEQAKAKSASLKNKKKAKRPSPPPQESTFPQPPPKRPTVRLDLVKVKKDNYIIYVPDLVYQNLKPTGHPWADWYEKNLEELQTAQNASVKMAPPPGLADIGGLAKLLLKYPTTEEGGGGGGNKKKKGEEDVYDIGSYDTKDPFVDDSELNVDEPTHFAKPKADGFYVTQGPVELAKLKPNKKAGTTSSSKEKPKPLSTRDSKQGFAGSINKLIAKRAKADVSLALPPSNPPDRTLPSSSTAGGSMQLDSILNSHPPQTPDKSMDHSMSMSISISLQQEEGTRESPIKIDDGDNGSAPRPTIKKNRYPTAPVDHRLQQAFDHLKALVTKESFAVKTKFPPTLKPPLIETAKLAVMLGEYNDNFFNYLPTIFPYNRFTMMKLTKREFFPHHIKYFQELQDEHMEDLGKLIEDSFPAQKAEYEAAYKAWLDRGGLEQENPVTNDTDKPNEEERPMDVDGAIPNEEDMIEPQKRWKWSDEMREEVFTIISIESAMCEICNEKGELENSKDQSSAINARKACYKRMANLFPEDGWTTSTNVSREFAQIKKKKDRQEARAENEVVDDSRANSVVAL